MIAIVVDVSTTFNRPSLQNGIHRPDELCEFLDGIGDLPQLLRPGQLAVRLNVLDELDGIAGDLDAGVQDTQLDREILTRVEAIRRQFEAANERLYETARSEIAIYGGSSTMRRWFAELAHDRDTEEPRPGLSFDILDDIASDVFQFHRPEEAGTLQSREMAPYQPTPVRHILDLIAACRFSSDDLLVDLGSGLGHVPLLVSILAQIRTVGVEVQPDHVASAQKAAQSLNVGRVRFVAEDARMTDLSNGTVFYLFSPFTGSILRDVLHRLRAESEKRQIRICALGPCTGALQDQEWLTANRWPDTERIVVFKSQ